VWRDGRVLGVVAVGLLASIAISLGVALVVVGLHPSVAELRFPRVLLIYAIFAAGGLPMTYANAVVIVAADARMRGETVGLGQLLARVNRRLPALLGWFALSAVVGFLLALLERSLRIVGPLLRFIGGLSWAVATVFVVPCIVFEDLGPVAAIRRSAAMFAAQWGLNVRAQVRLAASLTIALVVLLLGCMLLVVVVPVAGVVAFIAVVATFAAYGTALNGYLITALYRYSTDGSIVGPFTRRHLGAAFGRKAILMEE
jgi:hypothetical protein